MRFFLPDAHPLPDHYDVVACTACGFVYADTAASQADYDRYYADSSKYADPRTATGAGVEPWDDHRLEDTARLIARYAPPGSRVVDIGCANGGLLRWLAQLGYEHLLGVDPSPACVAAVRDLGIRASEGGLFELPPDARRADCVILSHVLEHVRDVGHAVALLRAAVSDGGIAYVEVPDATRYGDYLVAPLQDFNVEHINHFSPTSLSNALERGGFRVQHIGQKTIAASPDCPYPALWAIARAESRRSTPPLRFDGELREAIGSYVDASVARLRVLDRFLDVAVARAPRIIVWGTGQTALTLLAGTRLGGAEVVAFTDSNPRYHGRRLAGKPVVAPESLTSYAEPILIGSVLHQQAIASRIRELRLPNRVIALEAA
jgi:SAM-dependent methyltransferase